MHSATSLQVSQALKNIAGSFLLCICVICVMAAICVQSFSCHAPTAIRTTLGNMLTCTALPVALIFCHTHHLCVNLVHFMQVAIACHEGRTACDCERWQNLFYFTVQKIKWLMVVVSVEKAQWSLKRLSSKPIVFIFWGNSAIWCWSLPLFWKCCHMHHVLFVTERCSRCPRGYLKKKKKEAFHTCITCSGNWTFFSFCWSCLVPKSWSSHCIALILSVSYLLVIWNLFSYCIYLPSLKEPAKAPVMGCQPVCVLFIYLFILLTSGPFEKKKKALCHKWEVIFRHLCPTIICSHVMRHIMASYALKLNT